MTRIVKAVARRTSLPEAGVGAVISLLDEGATVPFISRYRKERTGSLDEVAVRAVETALEAVRELEKRREFVLGAVAEAGSLTPELRARIEEADTSTDLEDLYAPYKPKRRTRASIAREKGFEPLAKRIMAGRMARIDASEEAVEGACDIIAEWASETPRLRNMVRRAFSRDGFVEASAAKDREKELETSPYAEYAGFSRELRRCRSHQYLALRRAEAEGFLKLKYTISDEPRLVGSLCGAFGPKDASRPCRELIDAAVTDAYKRLIKPSVENETASALKEEADTVAIGIFSDNLRQLLLAPPLRGRRVLALDPGFRTGCKVVAVDEQGALLADAVIYPVEPRRDTDGAARILSDLIRRHRLDVVALGNGTASRETERFLASAGLPGNPQVYVVSESGASVYSASDIARAEFPDKDVTVRGAVSIGRRLIDPLAELVKIDPKSIGVGQYQHDVDQSRLQQALDYTVMSCVNSVGVDVNTASAKLLGYISGIGPLLASNIVKYRTENGPFASRSDLRRVPRMGDKAYELSAGFLRVPLSANPLDNTGIHPESYAVVEALARRQGIDVASLAANGAALDRVDVDALAAEGLAGRETLADIVAELRKPGRDPRVDDAGDAFVPEVSAFDELREGMVLPGLVSNITAFGAFVNIGIKESGLLHISEISSRRVNSVSDVLRLGQQVRVKVIGVDTARKRISLSMKGI